MKTTKIYGLFAKKDSIIRYVGKADNPEKRLKRHIQQVNYSKTHKNCWLKSLLKNNEEISFIVLEEVKYEDWQMREKFWIIQFDNLTNTCRGGMGGGWKKYKIGYEECKLLIQKNYPFINSKSKWYVYKDILSDIPKSPRDHYKNNGWISWGDFLGTNRVQDNMKVNYLSYTEAKNWLSENRKFKTSTHYKKSDLPDFTPNRPERYYKNKGWISWADFLGNNNLQNQKKIFLSYDECVLFLKNNYSIINHCDFRKRRKYFPDNVPRDPKKKYLGNGWKDWKTFLQEIR